MSTITIITIVALILCLSIAIWLVGATRKPCIAYWSGMFLVIVGLAASLVMPFELIKDANLPEYSYLSNAFLIVAAVGANFVAGSVLVSLRAQ